MWRSHYFIFITQSVQVYLHLSSIIFNIRVKCDSFVPKRKMSLACTCFGGRFKRSQQARCSWPGSACTQFVHSCCLVFDDSSGNVAWVEQANLTNRIYVFEETTAPRSRPETQQCPHLLGSGVLSRPDWRMLMFFTFTNMVYYAKAEFSII